MNPIPEFEDNSNFYNETYWKEHHNLQGIKSEYPILNRQKRMLNWIKPHVKNNDKILEIGCGFGFNLDYLRKNTTLIPVGIELSESGCYNTKEAFKIECHHTSIEKFSTNDKFQFVLMSHVLEHFENPPKELNSIYNLLDTNGILWIEVPNILFPNPTKTLNKWLSKEHISYFSPNKLKLMLERAGFEILMEEHSHYCCVMAKKCDKPINPPKFTNEINAVKLALFRHRILYNAFKLSRKFGIKLFSYNK